MRRSLRSLVLAFGGILSSLAELCSELVYRPFVFEWFLLSRRLQLTHYNAHPFGSVISTGNLAKCVLLEKSTHIVPVRVVYTRSNRYFFSVLMHLLWSTLRLLKLYGP